MKEKPLINAEGEVWELTQKDIRSMRPASKVLPKDLLGILPEHKNRVTLKTFKDTDANKNLVRCKNAKDMFEKLGIKEKD
jgi:hypothetical protein